MSRWSLGLISLGAAVGAVLLQQMNLGHVPWAVSRASGLASFVVLSLSVILGLLISTKASDGLFKRIFTFEMHQFLAVLSLTLIGVHAGSLLFDGFLRLSPVALVVPFASPYKTVAVAAGVGAAWLAALTTASFWARSRIGVKRWRRLHYLTFGAYVLALGHGISAGTDSGLPWVYWGYVLSAATVGALLAFRIAGLSVRSPGPRAAANAKLAASARR
jgi:sulfoxide reductase heme-binding subunit YedZ